VDSALGEELTEQQCALTAKRGNCILQCIKQSTTSQSKDIIIPLDFALLQPHLQYRVQFWAPQLKRDVKVLECILRRAPKLGQGLSGVSSEERLRALCLVWRAGGCGATSLLSAAS